VKTTSLLAWAACSFALPAAAILIRPDRDDSEYLELATHYSSSVRLKEPAGEGVLVAARWILTTAASARKLQESKVKRIAVGSSEGEIVKIELHEGLGLIALKSDVKGVPFTPVYRGGGEGGQTVIVASRGATGKIGSSGTSSDGKARASINTIENVTTSSFQMRIKPAADASDLQGALAPSDLGAAAYLRTSAGMMVAGLALSTDGTVETYARLSAYSNWIDAAMLKLADQEMEALLGER